MLSCFVQAALIFEGFDIGKGEKGRSYMRKKGVYLVVEERSKSRGNPAILKRQERGEIRAQKWGRRWDDPLKGDHGC